MDRLTARSPKNNMAYLVNVKNDEQEVECKYPNTLQCILDSFQRLAEYEDTGFTPEKVIHLKVALAATKAMYDVVCDAEEKTVLLEKLNACHAQLADTQAALAEAVGVLEFISFQPCENSKNAVAFGSCLQSNDCLTEYCLPCYAKAYIQSPAAKAAGERMRAMERVVEAARAYTCNPGNRLDHYHRLCAAVAAYEMEVGQ